jgi:hypothetical protein
MGKSQTTSLDQQGKTIYFDLGGKKTGLQTKQFGVHLTLIKGEASWIITGLDEYPRLYARNSVK